MRLEYMEIENIPALLWGWPVDKVIIAVHGSQSSKGDDPIRIMAEYANMINVGYQTISFDLPGHGDRKGEDTPCTVQACLADLATIMDWARKRWQSVSLFAVSLGAYLSLTAYSGEALDRAWFLSPLVDMRGTIENMMDSFGVTGEQLQREQAVATPIGQTLYWDDYAYVREHPVSQWTVPTEILYGEKDDTCERSTVEAFARRFSCSLEIVPEGEHYFHTPEQMEAFVAWIKQTGLWKE